MRRARSLSGQLHALFRARRQNLAAIAHGLARMQRERLYSYLGYASVYAYAYVQHGMGKSKVCELIGISRGCERLPETREAFDSGRLGWTKAREVTKVATPETEVEWLGRADVLTGEELRAARRCEPPTRRRFLVFSPENAARYDQLVAEAKREGGALSDADAVLALLQRGAAGGSVEAPTTRLVVSQCPTCHEATAEAREGSVPLPPGEVERVRCAGEVHDLTQASNRVTRHIPASTRRRVLDRDRRRCRVPGCRTMSLLEVHHADGWRKGHDPGRLLTLCTSHHSAVHMGTLRVEGTAPAFRFVLLDGRRLGEGGEAVEAAASPEKGGSAEFSPEFSPENAARGGVGLVGVEEGVVLALRALGLSQAEARRRLLKARQGSPGGPRSELDLIRAALAAG